MNGVERILAIIAGALIIAAYAAGGRKLCLAGFLAGLSTLRSAALLMILAFAISGLTQVLIPAESIRKWLGRSAGMRGLVTSAAVGALTPGGPYVYYPIAGTLHRAGVGMGTLMAYVAGKSLWDLPRLPLELAFLGPRFTAVRLAVTLLIPPLAGYLADRLFGSFTPTAAGGTQQ